ncbi:MAG: PDZ domain-containing protein, partial [Alphaproteobacteria bacterium]|nr:PDZ domain-containing protein [Alphaproteobacteria bacterium]
IPVTAAEPVIKQLIKHGQVKRGWLGVHIQAVTDEIAETLGLKSPMGALVASVIKDGPAEKAKIQAGDVIVSFDGKEINEMRRLPKIVADTEVGKQVSIEIWRDKKKVPLKIAIGELEEGDPQVAAKTKGAEEKDTSGKAVDALGLTLAQVSPKTKERFNLDQDAKGVVVTAVKEGGPSAEKGIRPGDVIVEVSQEEVSSPAQVASKIEEAKKAGRKSVLLLVEGQGGLRFVAVRIGKG